MENQTAARICLTTALLALAACGGGDNADTPIAGPGSLFFGSTDPNASATGLAYANNASTLADLNGQTAQVRMVRFIHNNQTNETQFETTDESVTISDLEEGDYTITFGGETITFSFDFGTLANGADIETSAVAGVGPGISGDVSTVFAVYSYIDEQDDFDFGENTEGVFAIGFETNPETIDALSGHVNYAGEIGGLGLIFDQNGTLQSFEEAFGGEIQFVADFTNNTISGEASISLLEVDEFADTNLTLAATAITGNGFAGALVCDDANACTSDSQIGGAFYGDNGQELTGITGLNLTNNEGIQYIATGGFVTTPGPD